MSQEDHGELVGADEVARVFREGSGRAVAALIRAFGDIDVAEDAIQDAFAVALERWPRSGVPPNPWAWIVATGRNRCVDRLRRESLGRALLADAVEARGAVEDSQTDGVDLLADDRLRLIFTCCHPSLSGQAQVVLTLRLLCGLSTADVARAFLVEEATMAQRIVRAKRKIKSANIPYRVPEDEELSARLRPVLAVIYLVYNAGFDRQTGGAAEVEDLCIEAMRLARLLHTALPNEMEVAGLFALLLFSSSRRATRFNADGELVLLRDQDRTRWDQSMIDEGRQVLRTCLARDEPGPFQIQAAIQAVHSDAPKVELTDWPQIVSLYDELLHMTRSQVVALNRAIAVGEVEGPAAALRLVDELAIEQYHLFHAVRADMLRRLKRSEDAATAYRRAASQAPTEAERAYLEARASEMDQT